ncbi:MAG TPA: hypothetical protein QF753_13490 [Victivallales bacterium]|nr:hypothetical protein [Victivallales bacterium]
MIKTLDNYAKEDWLLANTHNGLAHDTDIYRIFRVDHLYNDLIRNINTLVNPCYETQSDDLENPLKDAKFDFEGNKHQLFRGLMAEYYTQSWSLNPIEWGHFGEGFDVIRVQAKAGKLFDRLMDDKDPFHSLVYHMGLIKYEDTNQIYDKISNAPYYKFLDSRGYGLLNSVLKIRADFQKEEEVRLLYIRSPRKNYTEPQKHRVLGKQNQFCSHLFEWRNVIEYFELDPNNKGSGDSIITAIRNLSSNQD